MKRTKKNTPKARRWSLGLYRNASSGKLVACYVTVGGKPMPYQNVKSKILFHEVLTDMTYSEARKRLVRDSKLTDKPVAKKAPAKKSAKEEHPVMKKAA